ncbi:MAG: VCBS repeat-containing protein [Pirellulales bacterium]
MTVASSAIAPAGQPWRRHTIDNTSRGADGVRLADINGDGLLDVATGWEEGGRVRVYFHPGHERASLPWPAVTVGRVASPEDAVPVDLDGDGTLDIVSACEGSTRSLFVHWAPADHQRLLDETAWTTEPIPAGPDRQMWMYTLPLQVGGHSGIDLVVGSKGQGGSIGWLESPAEPRRLDAWRWHRLYDAGWIMSLEAEDVDGDGDTDVVASDRKGPTRGVLWLENPGADRVTKSWPIHRIGGDRLEVMFLSVSDLDGDGRRDIVAATRNNGLIYFRRLAGDKPRWQPHEIAFPPGTGLGKAVGVGDVDRDGARDLVLVTAVADPPKQGLVWMSFRDSPTDPEWDAHPISGPEGIKFDRVELIDLDGDGDMDAMTCEERTNLGVIWYENPTVP